VGQEPPRAPRAIQVQQRVDHLPQIDRPAPASLAEALALLGLLWDEFVRLRAETARLRDENGRLATRVQELEARLGQNSSNSSRPPSTDPPGPSKWPRW
jgi:hypothetical protein